MKRINKLAGKLGFYIIDLIRGTRVLDVYFELITKQYFSSTIIEAESQKRMKQYLISAVDNVPFYRASEEYENITQLPYLDKKTVIDNYGLFFSEDSNLKKSNRVIKQTGGSTGSPFTYYTSKDSQSYLWAGILLSWSAAGYEFGDGVGMLAGSSLFKSKSLSQRLYYKLMNVYLMDANSLDIESCKSYISDIEVKNIKFLYGYTTAIFEMSKLIIDSGIQLQLSAVITTSEVLTSEIRGVIEKAFGCKVFDQYGCNDAGLAAFECEYHTGLHLNTMRAFISIDESGCLHSTDMFNNVMPLINYSTGDLVEISKEECPCGRGFPLLIDIKGRSNDIIRTLSGDVLHSSFFNKLFAKEGNIQTYQATFQENKLTINLITDNENVVRLAVLKTDIVKKASGIEVVFVFNQPIVKLNNGKMKNLIAY